MINLGNGRFLARLLLSLVWLSVWVVSSASLSEASAGPSLLLSPAEIGAVQARRQAIPAVADAFNRMLSQSWFAGAPAEVKAEGWPRQLVELAFTGLVDSEPAKLAQAKAILANRTAGPDRYNFSIFNQDPRKYGYGQACTALVIGYDFLKASLNETEDAQAVQLLTEWGTGLQAFYRNFAGASAHNFHTSSVACLGLIGLALEGRVNAAPTWQATAEQEFRQYFVNFAYNPGGDYTEGYVYQQYGLPAAVLYLDALKRVKQVDLVQASNLASLWHFYLSAYGSDGKFPRYGDNSETPFLLGTDLFLLKNAKQAERRPQYTWLWQKLRGGNAAQTAAGNSYLYLWRDFDHLGMVLYYPEEAGAPPRSTDLPPSQLLVSEMRGTVQGSVTDPGGLAVLRSTWPTSTESTSLWLNNRWRWQNHQHYDPSSFTLEGYGSTLISNLNNKSYDDPNWGKWSQQNSIRIDPNQSGGDAPLSNFAVGLSSSLGTFPRFFQSDLADVLVSESRYAHANFHLQDLPNGQFAKATRQNVTPINRATRTVILAREFLGRPFYLMLDEVVKTGASQYLWQGHLPQSATGLSGVGSPTNPLRFTVGGAKLELAFLNQPQASVQILAAEPNRADRALRLTVNAPQLYLLTALMPQPSGSATTEFRQLQTEPAVYELKLGEERVQVIVNPEGNLINYEGWETDAFLTVGREWSQPTRRILFHEAKLARFSGRTYFSSNEREIRTLIGETVGGGGGGGCQVEPDFNGDGLVNLKDVSLLVRRLGQAGYETGFDLNCDQALNLLDLSLLFTLLRW